jgi:hypothetical protein
MFAGHTIGYISVFADVLMCFNSTLGLFKPEVSRQFHSDYPPLFISELPESEKAQITG